jgi:hypothetical protein
MSGNVKNNMHKVRLKKQCLTCPFSTNKEAISLTKERIEEIKNYIMSGLNHLCHSDITDKTVCYGGRKFQLDYLYKTGFILEPTHKALYEAMKLIGIEPNQSIIDGVNQEQNNT